MNVDLSHLNLNHIPASLPGPDNPHLWILAQVWEGSWYVVVVLFWCRMSRFDHLYATKPTPRELQILQLYADGLCRKLIARQLDIGLRTVDFYFDRMHARYGCEFSAGDILLRALACGDITVDLDKYQDLKCKRGIKQGEKL